MGRISEWLGKVYIKALGPAIEKKLESVNEKSKISKDAEEEFWNEFCESLATDPKFREFTANLEDMDDEDCKNTDEELKHLYRQTLAKKMLTERMNKEKMKKE